MEKAGMNRLNDIGQLVETECPKFKCLRIRGSQIRGKMVNQKLVKFSFLALYLQGSQQHNSQWEMTWEFFLGDWELYGQENAALMRYLQERKTIMYNSSMTLEHDVWHRYPEN